MAFDETTGVSAMAAGLNGFDKAMGTKVLRASGDEVVLEYVIGEQHRQPYGIVHGGVHCAMVETACSTGAGLAVRSQGRSVVGIENHTSFIRAVRSGRIEVTARPITRGRRSQLWEATSRNDAGEIVSTGRVRLLCLDPDTVLDGQTVGVKQG